MKLNNDCIRDILMFLEKETRPHCLLSYSAEELMAESKKLSRYGSEEILYHVLQCAESGFFLGFQQDLSGGFMLMDISPKAHQFLANIRNDNVWSKTKEIGAKLGTTSLDAMCKIASNVVIGLIQSQLNG